MARNKESRKLDMDRPPRRGAAWIVAHRGASGEAPENTRAAFETALAYPIHGIEFDVQMSNDGVPVLFHDRNIAKINGLRKPIADFSFRELSAMDWGGWFSSRFDGEPIVTLEQALKLYGGRTRLLVEIKSFFPDRSAGRSGELTLLVLEAVNACVPPESKKNVFFLSFDREVLALANESDPAWQCVLNLSKPFRAPPRGDAGLDYLYAYCVAIGKLTPEFAAWTRSRDQRLMTYTCNTTAQVKKALTLAVDVIITDKPGWLVEYLGPATTG